MRYGAHIYLFTDHWADDQLHLLDTMKGLGVDVAEISVGDDIHFTHALTRARAEKLDMDLVIGPGGTWPVECDLSADDPFHRAAGLEWHKRQVDLSAELGALAYAGAIYGHPGVVKRRRPPVDEYKHTAEGLHALADYAQKQGVQIALEPMSHFRTHLVNTPDQLMHLITLADHANLYALFDTYHAATEVRDYATAIRTLGPRLWGVHPCENDRGVPGGGIVPWDAVFDALFEIGFDGPLTLESYNSSLGDFAYQRGLFHNVCPDGAEFVRRGIGFLSEHINRRTRAIDLP
ncbi:MAG: sugar phosphate isomerase/epimerase [Anaerolineales bacterium]|nr:sugar phosphate isomerase/epimerase [Anaerolineales bacterium]